MPTTECCAPSLVVIDLLHTPGERVLEQAGIALERPTLRIGCGQRFAVGSRPRGTSLPHWMPLDQDQESLRAPLLDQTP